MSIANNTDDLLIGIIDFFEVVDHVDVSFVDEDAFDGGKFFSYEVEVVLYILGDGFYLFFDFFCTDEYSCDSGEEESEFFSEAHGSDHAGEEFLCVHVNAEERDMVVACIVDAGDHFFTRVDTEAFGHVFLELGEKSVEVWLVLC